MAEIADIISDYPTDLDPDSDVYWQSSCSRVQCNAVMLKYGMDTDMQLLVSHEESQSIENQKNAEKTGSSTNSDDSLRFRGVIPHENISPNLTLFRLHSYIVQSVCPKLTEEIERINHSESTDEEGHASEEKIAHIRNTSPILVAELIRYIYTKEAHVNGERALKLVPLATHYRLHSFVKLLCKFLNKTTTGNTVCARLCHIQQLAPKDRPDLENACLEIFAHEASTALKYSQFLNLPERLIRKILKLPRLNCTDVSLFLACVRWARAQSERQETEACCFQEKLSHILANVSFSDMTKKELQDIINSNTVSEGKNCESLAVWLARDSQIGKLRARFHRRHIVHSHWHPELKRPTMFDPLEAENLPVIVPEGPSNSFVLLNDSRQIVPFPTNSYVLKSRSPVLAARLQRPKLWRTHVEELFVSGEGGAVVELEEPQVSPSDMQDFLRYLATDDVVVTFDNVLSLLHLASKYLVLTLCQACQTFLDENINRHTVLQILEAAHLYEEDKLFDACVKYITRKSSSKIASLLHQNPDALSPEVTNKLLKCARDSLSEKQFDKIQHILLPQQRRGSCSKTPCDKNAFHLGRKLRQILN